MNEQILQSCIELIDDAKIGCADLVFKEVCLEILFRARHILNDSQFRQLVTYAAERMKTDTSLKLQQRIMAYK